MDAVSVIGVIITTAAVGFALGYHIGWTRGYAEWHRCYRSRGDQ